MIIVIGRGHGGTRVISRTLVESGVYMGALNDSFDLVPAKAAYDACETIGQYISWPFNFSELGEPTSDFESRINGYLASILEHEEPKGWKLPENTLMYPWLVQMFPEAHFIHWVRNPLDSIHGPHLTDDLHAFNIYAPTRETLQEKRYQSWIYQEALVESTPRPNNFIQIWFEEFVLHQDKTLKKLEKFLNIPLVHIPVDPTTIGRYIVTSS